MNSANFKNRKMFGCLLAGMLLLPVALLAQQAEQGPNTLGGASKAGTIGMQFLQIGVSARATGMGEAFVALVDDASAAFYNPGALAELVDRQAMFNHTNLPGGLSHIFATYVHPLSWGTLALSVNVLTTGDMPVTVAFVGPTGETFSASDAAIGLSYAKRLTDRFSVGGTAKFVMENLAGFDARLMAFDVGTLYHTGFREMRLGMSVSNFGADMNFGEERDSAGNLIFEGQSWPLPITFRFGLALDVMNQENSKIVLAAQMVQPNDNIRYETFGAEYSWHNTFFLRGGFKFDEEGDEVTDAEGNFVADANGFSETFTAGAGIRANLMDFDGRFDVSWVKQDHLDDLIRFSALLSF